MMTNRETSVDSSSSSPTVHAGHGGSDALGHAPGPRDAAASSSPSGALQFVKADQFRWPLPAENPTRARLCGVKKRLFDLVVTLLGAVIWFPVLVLCAATILIREGWPIFYVSQRRVGAEIRSVIKYRTMVRNAAEICNRNTVPISNNVRFLNVAPDSPLYTRTGRVIERFALTEIPQFIHVLQGYMSLIGNRPLPEDVVLSLEEEYAGARHRFLTPAGLTGPVQLIGKGDLYDRERLMLEMTYCRVAKLAYSWRLDFLILWHTVLISLHIKKPLAVDQVKEMIVHHSKMPFFYPEGLRRRSGDDGRSRPTVWSEAMRRAS